MIVLPCNSLLIFWKRSGREYKEVAKSVWTIRKLWFVFLLLPTTVSSKPCFLINKRVELGFSKMFLIPVKNHATESSTYYNRFYWKQDPITSLFSMFQMQPEQQLSWNIQLGQYNIYQYKSIHRIQQVSGIAGNVHLFGTHTWTITSLLI